MNLIIKQEDTQRFRKQTQVSRGRDSQGLWEGHVHIVIFKMDNQQRPIVQHMELCSMLCGSLSGRGTWGRMRVCVCVKVPQLCPPLCDPMDCSLPGSSVHGVLQARILEWVDIPSSRGSSQPRDQTQVSHTAGRFFTIHLKLPNIVNQLYSNIK